MELLDEDVEYYPIIDISDQDIDNYEQMGTKSKFWYTDSKTGQDYLFKSIRTEDKYGTPIERKGEDWAEKIACEVAELLGIPHAEYDLATYHGERGIRSKKFTNDGENMSFGNELIEYVVQRSNSTLEKGQRSQTLFRVNVALIHLVDNPPRGWHETDNIKTAEDVFIGYLLFDALISNQDRHNENWGAISGHLAPSFDHAASLGRNESAANMLNRLKTKDKNQMIPAYVKRSKSWFYHKGKKLKTAEAFIIFGYLTNCEATIEWLERLERITKEQLFNIIQKIPNDIMEPVEKVFCISMLEANKANLLRYKGILENELKKV
jgi:hypothetical protein